MSTVDVNSVIVTGENSVIRLNKIDSDAFTTHASFWRILTSPAVRARVEARLKRHLALQRLLEMANPTADSADKDTKGTTEGVPDQHAPQEAAQSYAEALSSVEQHPAGEEI